MKTLALGNRGLAPLAAILIVAVTATVADARIGGLGTGALRGMTTPHLDLGVQMDRHRGPTNGPPPARPPQRERWPTGEQGGGGTTGGFTPGGGSGPTVKKKPDLQ
jgi:hypothetical protein